MQDSMSLRKKSELRRTLYEEARSVKDMDKEKREEQVSLESAFTRFITAEHVEAYYQMVPLIASVMESIKSRCMDKKLQKLFDGLLRATNNSGGLWRQLVTEIESQLDELEAYVGKMVYNEIQKLELDVNQKMVQGVLGYYWAGQRQDYLNCNVGLVRLTQSYILNNLLGFNMNMKEDDYQAKWRTAVLEYLRDLDHCNVTIIMALEDTERELDALYLTMKNVVSFKSLVILTIWRLCHIGDDSQSKSIVQLLCPGADEDEDHKWTLAYGTFFRDYQLFIHWHQRDFEGNPVHLNLLYIDFEASPASSAIPVHILKHNKDIYANTSFAGIFINHSESLPLSYMLPEDDVVPVSAALPQSEAVFVEEKKRSIRSMFTG